MMTITNRSPARPTRHPRRIVAGWVLVLAAPGCGGDPGSVHLDRPIDERAIGAPKPSPTSPGRPALKKAADYRPG